MLTKEQSRALNLIESGHSCVILGQAGTGKSYLIKEMLKRIKDKRASVTASTGLAARQFQGATTIHHWAGLGDGRFENQHLLKILSEETKSRIQKCDLLVIDEISMISRKIFEKLEFICRSVREPSLYFGGLQVVCVGDFFQLPPVPNDLYRDPGDHAFTSDVWTKTITHIITLKTVIRQSDEDLILAINELERGIPSHQTNQLMLALDRPSTRSSPCFLFGTNFEVDCFNMTELHKMPGEPTSYCADEEGEQKYLRKIIANKLLLLKEGAPVMLIRNLSDSLVNGLLGTVLRLEDDGPTVKFEDKIIKLNKVTFSVFDPAQCATIAQRKQFPIALAFAMTVHKSQGLTLPNVVVDCKNIFQAGQMGVAVGRSTDRGGLCVRNYDPKCCKQHPQAVNDYCSSLGVVAIGDLSCCQKVFEDGIFEEDFFDTSEHGEIHVYVAENSDESDFEEDDMKMIEELERAENSRPEGMDHQKARHLLTELRVQNPLSDNQKILNSDIIYFEIHFDRFLDFVQVLTQKIESMKSEHCSSSQSVKNWTSFYSSYHSFLQSKEYNSLCKSLFSSRSVNDLFCGSVATAIRKNIVTSQTEQEPEQPMKTCDTFISDFAHGKIRYVGGRAVAKLKYHNTNLVRNDLRNYGKILNQQAKVKVEVLQSIIVSQADVECSTKFPRSIIDVKRKQNLSCGLTNITDGAFQFFLELEKTRIPLYSEHELKYHGQNVLQHIQATIVEDRNLFNSWTNLFSNLQTRLFTMNADLDTCSLILSDIVDGATAITCLFKDIVNSYLRVTDSEYRKKLLEEVGQKKSMEHRKKVLTKGKAKSSAANTNISIHDLLGATNREAYHLKLKAALIENSGLLNIFKKKELLILGKFYNTKLKQADKKEVQCDILRNTILNCDKMPNPDIQLNLSDRQGSSIN
ncbi:uncharacterized protein LOC134258949 [Saccostrea cucullata]|uniref:uncharacterized protein LOC134258949 n=1 Tax=Saccostrea cuccullata TaxID=36930 RepID=UPI002ED59CE9